MIYHWRRKKNIFDGIPFSSYVQQINVFTRKSILEKYKTLLFSFNLGYHKQYYSFIISIVNPCEIDGEVKHPKILNCPATVLHGNSFGQKHTMQSHSFSTMKDLLNF